MRFVLIIAGVGTIARMECAVVSTTYAHYCSWRSCFSRRQLTEGGSGKQRDDFDHVLSPSEWITRAEVTCLFTAPPFFRYRLLTIRVDRPLHQSNTHAMKNRLEPLRLKTTARCASRGENPFYITQNMLLPAAREKADLCTSDGYEESSLELPPILKGLNVSRPPEVILYSP